MADLEGVLSKRQDCIEKIRGIDVSIEKMTQKSADKSHLKSNQFRGMIKDYQGEMKGIMETASLTDRGVVVMLKEESENLKTELLRIRHGRRAASGLEIRPGDRLRCAGGTCRIDSECRSR